MGSKVKEVSVSMSKKIGLPNYSSLSIMASATFSVDDGDIGEAYHRAWEQVKLEIEAQEKTIK